MDKENETTRSFRAWKNENAVLEANPLPRMTDLQIPVKQRNVAHSTTDLMHSQRTGEMIGEHTFTNIKWVDTEAYVKVFANCISDSYKLNAAGIRVLLIIIHEFIKQEMKKGASETVELVANRKSLNGHGMPCSFDTWNRGIKDLCEHRFIWPRTESTFWVSPMHFMKGDRIKVVTEYHLIKDERNNRRIDAELNIINEGITEVTPNKP